MSFEPSPSNYYVLNRNIELNKLGDKISALCIAFNDTTRLDSLFMSSTTLGDSNSSFAEAIDWKGKPLAVSFRQTMIGFSIDDFVCKYGPVFPNHIKIDVDGIEDKIIRGAEKTLSDKRVKSVLVELDSSRTDYAKAVIASVEKAGIKFVDRKHASMFDKGEYSSGYNYIFRRP
jgi:FkbM family methyltransferase